LLPFFKTSDVNVSSETFTPVSARMDVLWGDANASHSVNSTDVSQVKLQSGTPVTASNFRNDIGANGAINSSDVSTVKQASGTALP
jgi:hypothetical protein